MNLHAPLAVCTRCGAEVYAPDAQRPGWMCAACRNPDLRLVSGCTDRHCGVVMSAWELPDYYDGALFWVCESCGAWRHRFPPGHWLHGRAMQAIWDGCIEAGLEIARG